MKQILATITVAVTLVATSASAFDPVHLKRLKETNECLGCELISANLANANLNGADLSEAKLSGANLKEAILDYTIMDGAILCNTTMPDGSVIYSGC